MWRGAKRAVGFGTPERKRSRSPASSGLGGDDDQFPDDEEHDDETGGVVDSVGGLSGSAGFTPAAIITSQDPAGKYVSAGPSVTNFTTSITGNAPQFVPLKTIFAS